MTEELINKIATINCNDNERQELYIALKSKIPIRPTKQYTSCGIHMGDCPSCKSAVDGIKNPYYCTNKECLQLLDWDKSTFGR